jgi:hypothetical protein
MKPAWLTAFLARDRLNAARDRRQALRCIDTQSQPGSWQAVLDSGAHSIRVLQSPLEAFERQLDANLAKRRALRPKRSEAAHKGWETRRA